MATEDELLETPVSNLEASRRRPHEYCPMTPGGVPTLFWLSIPGSVVGAIGVTRVFCGERQ